MGVVDEDADLPATTLEMAQAAFDFAAQDTRTLTDEQILGLLDAREAISGMLQAVEAYALATLQSDSPPDVLASRYKVVRGRSNRKWMYDDPGDMFAELKKVKIHDAEKGKDRGLGKRDLYEEKLKSPTSSGEDPEEQRRGCHEHALQGVPAADRQATGQTHHRADRRSSRGNQESDRQRGRRVRRPVERRKPKL